MNRPEVRQFIVSGNPGTCQDSLGAKEYIVRVGPGISTGDFEMAFATVYTQLGRVSIAGRDSSRYVECTTVEARLTGLDKCFALEKEGFSEARMYQLLMDCAERKAREIISFQRVGEPLALGNLRIYEFIGPADFSD